MDSSIYLSLGSNLEDRKANLEMALQQLQTEETGVQQQSSIYETEPVDLGGIHFNGVTRLRSRTANPKSSDTNPLTTVVQCREDLDVGVNEGGRSTDRSLSGGKDVPDGSMDHGRIAQASTKSRSGVGPTYGTTAFASEARQSHPSPAGGSVARAR